MDQWFPIEICSHTDRRDTTFTAREKKTVFFMFLCWRVLKLNHCGFWISTSYTRWTVNTHWLALKYIYNWKPVPLKSTTSVNSNKIHSHTQHLIHIHNVIVWIKVSIVLEWKLQTECSSNKTEHIYFTHEKFKVLDKSTFQNICSSNSE